MHRRSAPDGRVEMPPIKADFRKTKRLHKALFLYEIMDEYYANCFTVRFPQLPFQISVANVKTTEASE